MLSINQNPITINDINDNSLNENQMATLTMLTLSKNVKWQQMLCKPLNIKQLCH